MREEIELSDSDDALLSKVWADLAKSRGIEQKKRIPPTPQRHQEIEAELQRIYRKRLMDNLSLLTEADVEWVVNSLGELGVKIGDQFFFLYKGRSFSYANDPTTETDDAGGREPIMWRPVGKREFGECCHPINYDNPKLNGTVSLNDGNEWKPLPKISKEENNVSAS